MTPPLREWRLSQSLYQLETPGLVRVTMRGGGSLEEVIETVALYRELAAVGPFFVLADMFEAGGVDAEARHYIDEHVRPEWLLGFIYFNTRLLHRSIAMGMLIAYELVRKEPHPWRGKIHFVDTEAEGRALHARLREEQLSGTLLQTRE